MRAPEYHRKKNFLDNNPDRTDHGAINDELDAVAFSVDTLINNVALIQKDDGSLENGIVGVAQLTPDAQAELSRPGPIGPQGPDGPTGPQGRDGPKGDIGASFNADARGLDSERTGFDGEPKGFSFLAMDTGLLYFKLSQAVADWSTGYTFGKGEKGDQGPQGVQGQRGLQGFRGVQGEPGPPGIQGPPGQNGVVDYGRVILNDTVVDQQVQGGFSARTLSASVSAAAPNFTFSGANARLVPNNNRLRLDNGANTPTLIDLELANVRTSGTGAANTGVKLANGVDLGTLFDPAGSAAGKIAGIAVGSASTSIAGKTQITVTLSLQNNMLVIGVS